MRKSIKLLLIITVIILTIFVVIREIFVPRLFSFGNPISFDNIVLIDSLEINNLETLYWFKYEGGVSSSSVSYISISNDPCQISKTNAIITGDLIFRIDTIKNDSIFIISQLGFKVIHNNLKYKFIDEEFSSDKKYKPKRIKEMFLRELCKHELE